MMAPGLLSKNSLSTLILIAAYMSTEKNAYIKHMWLVQNHDLDSSHISYSYL